MRLVKTDFYPERSEKYSRNVEKYWIILQKRELHFHLYMYVVDLKFPSLFKQKRSGAFLVFLHFTFLVHIVLLVLPPRYNNNAELEKLEVFGRWNERSKEILCWSKVTKWRLVFWFRLLSQFYCQPSFLGVHTCDLHSPADKYILSPISTILARHCK